MIREMNGRTGRHIKILLAAVAMAIAVFGGSALLSQPVTADTEDSFAITVNEGSALDKFEGQDNFWESELQYNGEGDKSGEILLYTLEDPENVPVGMEINVKFTANEGYSEDLLQVQGEKSGDLIDLNLEETDEGWTGTFLMPEEDVDITAYTQEEDSGEEDAVKTESAGPTPEEEGIDTDEEEDADESDDPDDPIVKHGFIVNGDAFIDKNEDGVWYYTFDQGKLYLDDSKSLKQVKTELKDKDYSMSVKIRNHETDELITSCRGDDSVKFKMPDADVDIQVIFEKTED